VSDHLNSRGFSQLRLDRKHDVMAGYVERGEVPGIVTISRPAPFQSPVAVAPRQYFDCSY
jgi:hypothetical protein